MLQPRSQKYSAEKRQKLQRQSRFWMLVNLTLIVLIGLVLTFSYFNTKSLGGKAVQDPVQDITPPISVIPNTEGNSPAVTPPDPSQASQDSTAETVGSSAKESLLIHFGGDTIFSGKVAEKMEQYGIDFPFKHVKDLFLKDDLTILNLETPVTTRGIGAKNKQFVFKAHPDALKAMKKAGVDAVNVANNHTLDQGVQGLLDTMDHLHANKIPFAGAGRNSSEAYAPVYIERKGAKIALFGFSRVLPELSWNAQADRPGLAGVYNDDVQLAVKSIQDARKKADLVIVVAHWGRERVTVPDSTQTLLAHSFVDAGADLVVGGHPHVLQGVEQYKGKWIAYSTGNFIFTKATTRPKTWDTAVFQAHCTIGEGCDLRMIPFLTEIGQPVPKNAQDSAKLMKEIESLSPGVKIDSYGNIRSIKNDTNPALIPSDAEHKMDTSKDNSG
ncbi:CapA family protein [Paenibacillus sp. YPG26]|uniref:CapA family protein n=1 Tax=Paenibacillus sp. YPG26 TaxID=2878915 RepID=UPI00203B3F4E|nr:CapA family protein [Paenibacillus sp. YPG26]USB32259.1 CapA family protein [Paenibacillus sp. YPG26]